MQSLGDGLFVCPRCGSLREVDSDIITRPWLIARLKAFRDSVHLTAEQRAAWIRHGIAESLGESVENILESEP